MKKKILIGLMTVGLLLSVPTLHGSVYAHEEAGDESGEHSLTVHIDPVEPPIAGEAATITYFLKSDFPERPFTAKLSVNGIDSKHFAELEPTVIEDKITSVYTFPNAGSYKLELTIEQTATHEEEVFSETVQVAAGKQESPKEDKGMSGTLKVLIVAINALLVVLLAYIFTRKKKK